MTKADEQPTITQSDHEVIYLAPKCFGVERSWCEDAGVEDCDCIDGPHDWIKFTRTTSLAAQPVDSGMSGDAVERAEWFWVNLPTGRKWTSLATHEKALVCHQIARIAPSLSAQDGLVEPLEELLTMGVPRIWKSYRGDYCVSMLQKEYFGATIPEAINAALSAIKGDKS